MVLFVQDNRTRKCKIENMWYRTAKEKFLYSPVIRKRNVSPFAAEEDPDKPEEINVSENPELLPDDLQPDAVDTPQQETVQPAQPTETPLLVDDVDPVIQSDNINKPSPIPPPKSPHDGCRCESRIREKISGGYEWKIDASMCPDCQAAARDYNQASMDALGVNNPISI